MHIYIALLMKARYKITFDVAVSSYRTETLAVNSSNRGLRLGSVQACTILIGGASENFCLSGALQKLMLILID